MVEISNIHILPINGQNNCVAIAQFTLAKCIGVSGVKLYKNDNGVKYVTYPKNPGNKHNAHFVYPITTQLRESIASQLWAEYDRVKNEETEA